jgi:outer membrane protein OmpA-like peptidoglycan-associated protein
MLRLAIPIILLLLMLFGGATWLISLKPKLPEFASKQVQKQTLDEKASASAADKATSEAPASATQKPGGDAGQPSFDIARIEPHGTSVFAGRAEPDTFVTITADGKAIGTAKADANGEWTFTTEQPIAGDPKLGLSKTPASQVPQVASAEARADIGAASPSKQRSAGAVTSHLLKNLESMVEAARTGQNKEVATAAPAPLPNDGSAAPLPPSSSEPAARTSVPVPITFIFNEATLTGDGKKAAGLLLEYLRLKHFGRVSLTGHADERGTEELNMRLSKDRLDTVASFLRDGGFKGELELVPKGKAEPYTGVVRSQFAQEDLYQLDRRVELVLMP